ncbi:hypothetical protein HETIRDRAFT_144505 [Heterobasidion irregulare TC 32-1]|uniref:Uncharacterized protein n=1 Tax=Heterobasidion irregulare (strain TC 32-1) TaxID=747525 RepID=W4JQ16_HETIT|nr:uncharacterized protein HETIRDRAFT_144505 [Heterobasidion irregulare TC 32-1]ETW75564.1 hypothetical protein HETIRDRAFT_144505 [Heterobasidion irregulare TC 32-1]
MSGKRALSSDDTVVPSSVTTTLTSDSTTDLHLISKISRQIITTSQLCGAVTNQHVRIRPYQLNTYVYKSLITQNIENLAVFQERGCSEVCASFQI